MAIPLAIGLHGDLARDIKPLIATRLAAPATCPIARALVLQRFWFSNPISE